MEGNILIKFEHTWVTSILCWNRKEIATHTSPIRNDLLDKPFFFLFFSSSAILLWIVMLYISEKVVEKNLFTCVTHAKQKKRNNTQK